MIALASTREQCMPLAWRWGIDMKQLILLIITVFYVSQCGNKSVYDCDDPTSGVPCEKRSKDEDVRVALNKGDLDTAVTLLKELVAAEPTKYERYPLLAAALAGRSGFDIFNVVKAKFGGDASLLETMSAFVPTPTTRGDKFTSSLTDMSEAVSTLNAVPAEKRADITTDSFATSCALQLTLYQSAYSIMLINQFAYSTSGYDPSLLSKMTPADAALILKNLLAAGAVVAGPGGEAASAAVNKAYSAIQAQSGATDDEKIANYVKANAPKS